jgi:hypothetical protein
MKKLHPCIIAVAIIFSSTGSMLNAQCPGGYSQAQVNWDNLDYYWNSGGTNTPYASYIVDAREQSQRFAIGTTAVTIATSNAAMVAPGTGNSAENATHTGEAAGYTGQDVQYNPSANGQTITLTFATPVSGPNFTLYDIDGSAVYTITATNNLGLATTVNAAPYTGSILTIGIVPLIRTVTSTAATVANNLNTGAATITVPGLVNSITITATTIGTDPVIWLSDINACVSGSFPTNWHQGANNRPFWGPTQTQPDYFLVTPDNNTCYYVDPATGDTRSLLTDATRTYVNSFGYDPYNRFLYYITENVSVNANNKQIKRYDYNTETSSIIVADITAAPLNIPTFNSGVESAGCSFYNGSLYFGIEGGTQGSGASLRTRESIVWRIDFDASNNPVSACQVFAVDAGLNGSTTSTHDWGDFIIRDGILFDFNTARAGCGTGCYTYPQSKFHHYNMMTGNMDALYTNPGTAAYSGQAALSWAGDLYYFRPSTGTNSVVGLYNEDGTIGAATTMTVTSGPAWPGGSGDASDPFRPKCDFGDAPSSYDPYATPATQSPAVHERSDNIRLGATWDYEYWKKGTVGTNDTDDGIGTVSIMQPGGGGYVTQVSAYNNSGANATLIAWLDYNGNGVFDASEANTPITVPSSASAQNFWLAWTATPNTFVNGQYTYLRVRITSASAGMTTSHPTGYFTNGEVEDYRVLVDNFPLATKLLSFDAKRQDKTVKLNWKSSEETGTFAYVVERSRDNNNWESLDSVAARNENGVFNYELLDQHPLPGQSFYRIRLVLATSMNQFSAVKSVSFMVDPAQISIAPNPAKESTMISFTSLVAGEMEIRLLNIQGRTLHTEKRTLTAGPNQIKLSIPESVSSGTYMIRLESNGEVTYKKIIVSK